MLRVEEATHRIALRVDERQREAIQAAASASGISMSEWVRRACARAVEAESAPQIASGSPARSPQASRFMDAVRRAAERRG